VEWHVLPSGRRIMICVRRNGMNKIEEIQAELRDRQIPAWLFYDHHHRDDFLPDPWIAGISDGLPTLVLSDSSRGRAGEAGRQNRALPPRYGAR
jgi:hypothetical protein